MNYQKKGMFLGALFLCVFLVLIVVQHSRVHASQQPPLIPLRDFFKNPEKAQFRISPDGSHISFLAPYQNRLNIFVQKIKAAQGGIVLEAPLRITGVTERDIAGHFWKNDELLMYAMDDRGDENFHLFGVSRDGSTIKDYTPFPGVRVHLVDILEDDENHLLISTNQRDKKVHDVYRLDVRTGALEMIAQNPGNVLMWVTDHAGKLRAAGALDGTQHLVLYRDTEAEPFATILTTDYKEAAWPALFTFDNKQLYCVSNVGRDKKSVVIFDPASKKETTLVWQHPEFDVSDIHFSRKRKVLTHVEYVSWKHEYVFFDAEIEALFARLAQKCGDKELFLTAHNRNEDKFIVCAASDRMPGAFYFYDLASDTLTKLADLVPWLKEEYLAPVKPIQYTARDGQVIHGYLTLPLGYEPKKLPLVVNPHGGPWERDTWSYNPELQFLANRGYAILNMNFRGSTGYGKRFEQLSFKQWGRAMQDDITDGVRWLIDQGIADPKRIAIYGASYGGYAALVGVTFTPDLFACGIDYVGISNIFTWLNSFPEYWKPLLDETYERVGHPEKDKELLTQISPLFHVDQIKVPLFVASGRMDPRVHIAESDQIVAALKKRGIEVEYMVKDNEGHGFGNEENKFDFYEAMEKFLARHLKP